MSTNGLIPSFRLPVDVEGLEPKVAEAFQNHDDAITDLQQAIPALKSQIDVLTTSTATGSTTENVTTSSEAIISEPSTIGMVNDQTGQTAYTTQQSDYGAFILLSDASPIAVTLAVGPSIQLPWYAVLLNEGVGLATLTPPSGSTISYPGNASAASMPLPQNVAAVLIYDGTNFEAILVPISPQNTPEITSQWLNSFNSATGVFGQSQPAIADVSGLAAALALLAPLASPTFSGTVTQPAPAVLTAATTATSATAGSASALPATPAGYLETIVNGVTVKLAYYSV